MSVELLDCKILIPPVVQGNQELRILGLLDLDDSNFQ